MYFPYTEYGSTSAVDASQTFDGNVPISWTTDALANAARYEFSLAATNEGGTVVSNSIIPVEVLPGVPSPTVSYDCNTWSDPEDDTITVSWATIPTASGYKISYVDPSSNETITIDLQTATTATIQVPFQTTEFTYSFSVTSYNDLGDSEPGTASYKIPIECPSLVVTTDKDEINPNDREISLREAIEIYSKLDGLGSEITFATNVQEKTIKLTDGQLIVDHTVSIVDESKSIVIDADCSNRIFDATGTTTCLTIDGLTLKNGVADYGGAIRVYDNKSGSLTIRNTTFLSNAATSQGGAVYAYCTSETSGSVTISDSTFLSNTADQGGAIYAYRVGNVSEFLAITRSTFLKNSASTGGAVSASYSLINIVNAEFLQNTTSSTNSGAMATENSSLTLENAILAENTGSALYVSSQGTGFGITLRNATISRNTGANAFYVSQGVANVSNSVVVNNSGGNARFSGVTPTVACSVIGGYGDFNSNFTDETTILTDDYRINVALLTESQRSLLIDAGVNDQSTQEIDLAGRSRIFHSRVDLGAYELHAALDIAYSLDDETFTVSYPETPDAVNYVLTYVAPNGTSGTLYEGTEVHDESDPLRLENLFGGEYVFTLQAKYADETSETAVENAFFLATPGGLAATWTQKKNNVEYLTKGDLAVTWDAVNGASGYELYVQKNGVAQEPITISNGAATTYVFESESNGSTYAFSIAAVSDDGTKSNQAELVELKPIVISYVQNASTREITLTASPTGAQVGAYKWYYNNSTTSTPNFVQIEGANSASYTPTGATLGRTIRVVAIGAEGSVSAGSVAALEIVPSALSTPQITATSSYNAETDAASITVVSNGVDDAISYRLDYSFANGVQSGTSAQEFAGGSPISFTVLNVLRGATYEFTLTALNDGGSTASNTVTALVAPSKPSLTPTYSYNSGTDAVAFDVSAPAVPGATSYAFVYTINGSSPITLPCGSIAYGENVTIALPLVLSFNAGQPMKYR